MNLNIWRLFLCCCNLDRISLFGRIPVGVKIKVYKVFYTHTSIKYWWFQIQITFTWLLQRQIQDFPGGGANSPGGGRQHTILPNFPKNCMKLKEFGCPGGARAPCAPPKSATVFVQFTEQRSVTVSVSLRTQTGLHCPLFKS